MNNTDDNMHQDSSGEVTEDYVGPDLLYAHFHHSFQILGQPYFHNTNPPCSFLPFLNHFSALLTQSENLLECFDRKYHFWRKFQTLSNLVKTFWQNIPFYVKSNRVSDAGDEILSINGQVLQGMTHGQAIAVFKNIKHGMVSLHIARRQHMPFGKRY